MSMARKIAASLFVFGMLLSAGTASASVRLGESNTNSLSNGLVGYWPLDGNTTSWKTNTTQDVSGNGNTGQLIGMSTTTSPVPGKIGGALKFNGSSSYVFANTAHDLSLNGTISAWVNVKDVSTNQIVVSDIYSSTNRHYINISSGIVIAGYYDGSDHSSSGSITKGWHHLVAVFSGTNPKLYVDGVLQSGTTVGSSGATVGVSIGARTTALNFFNGAIDDVRIYNRALSAAEIKQLYTTGLATVDHSNTVTLATGLVGYWPLDGNTTSWKTNTTQDVSGNGNTGQLISMSTTTSPVAGKIGEALKFNGSTSYINADNSSSLQFGTNSFTVIAWIKSATSANQRLVNKFDNSTSLGFLFDFNESSVGANVPGNLRFRINDGTNAGFVAVAAGVTTNVWQQVAVTINRAAGTATFYRNGAQAGSPQDISTVTGSITTSQPFSVGNIPSVPGNFFTGAIDDVRIYNRALSAQEVQQLYKLGTANVAHSNTVTLATGLVGYWPLDGNTTSWKTNTTQDVSGNGNTGQLIGMSTTTSPVPGKIGGALKFNGAAVYSYVLVPTISIPSAITVSAWVYSSNFSQNGFIVQKAPVNTQWELFLNAGDSKLYWRGGAISGATCGAPSNGTWHHVVGSQAGTTATLYIDGVRCGANAGTVAIGNGAGNIWIGAFDSNHNYDFNGTIDDVRIYNRALSAQEVVQLYAAGR